jgi:hypothetical protein
MLETDALIENGRLGFRHEFHGVVPLVICDDDEDIWPFVFLEWCGTAAGDNEKQGCEKYAHRTGGMNAHVANLIPSFEDEFDAQLYTRPLAKVMVRV